MDSRNEDQHKEVPSKHAIKVIKRAEIERERESRERVEIAHMYLLIDRYSDKAAEHLGRKK